MELTEILAELWPGRDAEVEELGGGITNRNFKIAVDGETVVLRLGGNDTELLGIDRTVEYGASLVAAESGVGPDVIRYVEPHGWLVTRYLEGHPVSREELRKPATLRLAAETLRRIHEGPEIPGRFDSFRVVEGYRATAEEHGVPIPAAYGDAHRVSGEIERARGAQPLTPCHNDLLSANFISDGTGLRIVDWEYAGMGDRFFDLANFSVNQGLDPAENEYFLAATFGEADAADLAALALMRFMSDFREAMWGVVQQGISELDFDFVAYAAEHFERLERTAADERFRKALEGAA
jgi:thiamine kinase-like enzyme